jgi:CPA2 family monovalent cation:H+ antiporter-2
MHGSAQLVYDLAVVLGVAAVTSVLARLLRQPTILGHLLAGMIVGPYIPIPLFADHERIESLAELGVVLVMFAIGIEFRFSKLMRVAPTAGFTGLIQVSFLLWCGFTLGQALGWSSIESVFLGASIAISSTMVVSRVLVERPVPDDVRQHVLGVLVIQDVLAIALIAAMTATAAGGGLGLGELMSTLGRLGAVLAALIIGGMLVVPRVMRLVLGLGSKELTVVFSIGVCFALAFLASSLGYSVALGAFIAGMLVAESGKGDEVEHLVEPLRDVFAAIFFVSIGMQVDPRQVLTYLPTSLLVFAVVVVAQFVSVSFAGVLSGNGLRRSLAAGLSLGQIGEFAFILAAIGIGANAVRFSLKPILVTVAMLTAFTTPICIGAAERAVSFVDRVLPHRVQFLLTAYEEWFERLRSGEKRERPPVRAALRVIALDAVGLIVVAAVAMRGSPALLAWSMTRFELTEERARFGFAVALIALSLPLLISLFRNTVALGHLVGAELAGNVATKSATATRHAAAVMVYLLVALAIGFPAVAVLRSLTTTPYLAGVFAALIAAIGLYAWRSAGELDEELRSGAERVADALARAGGSESTTLEDSTLVPGLDSVVGLRVKDGVQAVGKTLAELNLRALTGATVVAIHRRNAQVVLPTGHERIEAGDMLALTGTKEAVDKALVLVNQEA